MSSFTSPVNVLVDTRLCNEPIVLECAQPVEAIPADSFAKAAHPCQPKEFKDIFYVSGSNCFWLVPEKAFKKIKQAVQIFESKVLKASNKLAALSLQDIQLDSLMVSPSFTHFFTPEQKAEWQQLQHKMQFLADDPDCYQVPIDFVMAVNEKERMAIRMKALKEQAIKQAKEQKYEVDAAGRFYDPRQSKIKSLLARYKKARAAFVDTSPPADQIEALRKELQQIQVLMQEQSMNLVWPAPSHFEEKRQRLAQMEKSLNALVAVIAELAVLGIAVPEWALTGQSGCVDGASCYANWFAYLKEKAEAEAELKRTIEAFLTALGSGYASTKNEQTPKPPREVFKPALAAIERAEQHAATIQQQAQQAASRLVPPRVLAWEGEYEPQPMDALTKGDYPLREICSAALSDERFSYFSLWQLPVEQTDRGGNLLKLDKDPVLLSLLEQDGIVCLPFESSWFIKESGILRFEKVEEALEKRDWKVESLQSNRSRFEKHLSTMLLRLEGKSPTGLLDESPQAQLMRLMSYSTWSGKLSSKAGVEHEALTLNVGNTEVTGTSSSLSTSRSLAGGEATDNKVAQRAVASVSVDAEYYPLRGEIDLFRVKLPPAPTELKVKVKGQRSGKLYDFNLGAWSLLLHAKAWGKAGAMMSAGREISLNHTLGGVSLSGVDWVSKVEEKGKFEGEIGVEVGTSVSGALHWRPSAVTCQQLAIADEARLPLQLCKATTGLRAEIKKSFESPIVVSWRGKWLRLGIRAGCFGGAASAKAYLEFELDWQGAGYVVAMFQQLLRDCQYERVDLFADDESYQRLSKASQLALVLGLEMGQVVATGKDFVDKVYGQLNQSKNAGLIAWTLSGHRLPRSDNPAANVGALSPGEALELESKLQAWAEQLLPEALGSLLETMVARPSRLFMDRLNVRLDEQQVHSLQQITIARLLVWLNRKDNATALQRNRHKFTEAVVRMHSLTVSDKIAAYQSNIKELDNFMNQAAMDQQALKDELVRYRLARQALLNRGYEFATPIMEQSGQDYPKVVRTGWSKPK
ncbi:hypothetical protein [Aeromonas enteropelogenes]|uniref:hypothetical protein n=2 Tax=Aeromonas TaxID=642 RepID=UPI003BA3D0D4